MDYKAWDEIPYSFPNFNGSTVEVWEGISNLVLQFMMHVIMYQFWDWRTMLVKGAPGHRLQKCLSWNRR